jgi:hypothetical protein
MTTIEQPKAVQCVQCVRCAAVFKANGQRCTATTLVGRRTCLRHGGASTGPRTDAGKRKCAGARTVHGRQTTAIRQERSLGSARLAVLESVGFGLGLMTGPRTRGRKPDRMGEAYPELQALYQKLVIERSKHSA